MIKAAIKIVLALAVLNAAFRAGALAWDHYQLRDEAQQLIVFGNNIPTTDLHNRILQKANELDIRLLSENLVVRRDGLRTIADARYTQPLEYFPNQTYSVNLSFTVDSFALNPSTSVEPSR